MFLADRVAVPNVGGELVTKPGWADTFKRRRLSDGTEQAVLKDSFDREELFALLRPWAAELAIHVGRCF